MAVQCNIWYATKSWTNNTLKERPRQNVRHISLNIKECDHWNSCRSQGCQIRDLQLAAISPPGANTTAWWKRKEILVPVDYAPIKLIADHRCSHLPASNRTWDSHLTKFSVRQVFKAQAKILISVCNQDSQDILPLAQDWENNLEPVGKSFCMDTKCLDQEVWGKVRCRMEAMATPWSYLADSLAMIKRCAYAGSEVVAESPLFHSWKDL